jgi:hypothetical protein
MKGKEMEPVLLVIATGAGGGGGVGLGIGAGVTAGVDYKLVGKREMLLALD